MTSTPAKNLPPPRLKRVLPADLMISTRTAALFRQAAARGLIVDSPSNRLNFFAAAARARRLGTRNPAGFFAAIVRRGLWHHITAADEDAAREQLRQVPDFLAVAGPPRSTRTGKEAPEAPTDRATIRELIRQSLASAACRAPAQLASK